MANEEHLAILKKGVPAWNEWREQHPDIRPDLRGAYLSGANLSKANLRQADLRDAHLIEAHLSTANLSGASLSGASLSRANLSEANLGGAELSYANLYETFDGDTGKDSAREIREYFIPDFANWKDHDSYQRDFEKLVKDLKSPDAGAKSVATAKD
jgi:Pentapeptide repeats (8 copies)